MARRTMPGSPILRAPGFIQVESNGCRRDRPRLTRALVALLLLVPCAAAAPTQTASPMDPAELREGLRRRGLIDLLEYVLRESPPDDGIEATLLHREVLLAVHADRNRDPEDRDAALTEANAILRKLIKDHPDDPRALSWRLELGRSLLYDRTEPLAVIALYREGRADDTERLARAADQAIEAFNTVLALVEVQFKKLDLMSLAEYERLERQGIIERMELLEPQARYMRRWAMFYRAIAADRTDGNRLKDLRQILSELRQGDLLSTPHDVSHFQAQSQLLAGMCARRLGDQGAALQLLGQALAVVEGLSDPAEAVGLEWVGTLGRLEKARALRDARRFAQAERAVEDFRAWVGRNAGANLGLKLVSARLESSIYKVQAQWAEAAGNETAARRLREQAIAPLMALAQRDETCRDAVYSEVYAAIDPSDDPLALHPFIRSAIIAGLLSDAEKPQQAAAASGGKPDGRDPLVQRAIRIAEQTLSNSDQLDPELTAEILYNLAVAYYRDGRLLRAARTFVRIVDEFPRFNRAESAALLSVQIAQALAAGPEGDDYRKFYLRALRMLTSSYPDSDAARYWQFFYAQELEHAGHFAEAAQQYQRVNPRHDHYVEARLGRVRALANVARRLSSSKQTEPVELTRAALDALQAAEQFLKDIREDRFADADPTALERLSTLARVIQAEVAVLPGVDRYPQALGALESFESDSPFRSDLLARVLRARIIAYEGLGRLEEAESEIPRFMRSDPDGAAATLGQMLLAKRSEIEDLRARDRHEEAQRLAESALLMAEQLSEWAQADPARVSSGQRFEILLQLAQARLEAGRPEPALEVLRELDKQVAADNPLKGRIQLSLAEGLRRLKRYEGALEIYNSLFGSAPRNSDLWWQALLGDLTCRTELDRDPEQIIRVIEQHQFLYRGEFGSDRLRRQFEALLKRNRRRAEGPPQ